MVPEEESEAIEPLFSVTTTMFSNAFALGAACRDDRRGPAPLLGDGREEEEDEAEAEVTMDKVDSD